MEFGETGQNFYNIHGDPNQAAFSAAESLYQGVKGIHGVLDVAVVGSRAKGYAVDRPEELGDPIQTDVSDTDFALMYDSAEMTKTSYSPEHVLVLMGRDLKNFERKNYKKYEAINSYDVHCPDVSGEEYFQYLFNSNTRVLKARQVFTGLYLWKFQEALHTHKGDVRPDAQKVQSILDKHVAALQTLSPQQRGKIFDTVFASLTGNELASLEKMKSRIAAVRGKDFSPEEARDKKLDLELMTWLNLKNWFELEPVAAET